VFLQALVEMHQGSICPGVQDTLDEEDARDTVQESFLSVWKHLREFDSTASLRHGSTALLRTGKDH